MYIDRLQSRAVSAKSNGPYKSRIGESVRERVGPLVQLLWPFLLVLLAAVLLHIYDPWSMEDVISTVFFGVLVAIATAIIGLKQQKLQQALADANLVSTVASIRGSLEAVGKDFDAAAVSAVITKSRSGLPLLKYSKPWARREFLGVVCEACQCINDDLTTRLRARSLWVESDWNRLSECAQWLIVDLSKLKQPSRRSEKETRAQLAMLLNGIRVKSDNHSSIPFDTFKSAFHRGDVHERVRAMLDWDTLKDEIASGNTVLKLYREWSVDWLADNDALTVWHATPDRLFCDFYKEAAEPIALAEVGEKYDILPDATRATINIIARTFNFRTNSSGLHIAEIVTLQLADRLFLLDGNHRMAAMVRGPDGHLGPLGVQVVEYRIVHNSDKALVPEQLNKDDQADFHRVVQNVLSSTPGATPSDVWSAWRSSGSTNGGGNGES